MKKLFYLFLAMIILGGLFLSLSCNGEVESCDSKCEVLEVTGYYQGSPDVDGYRLYQVYVKVRNTGGCYGECTLRVLVEGDSRRNNNEAVLGFWFDAGETDDIPCTFWAKGEVEVSVQVVDLTDP